MNMQKTIQERNKSLDELEQKLRDSELEKQKSEKLAQTLKNELEPLRGQKDSLEEKLKTVTKDLELVTSGEFDANVFFCFRQKSRQRLEWKPAIWCITSCDHTWEKQSVTLVLALLKRQLSGVLNPQRETLKNSTWFSTSV